MQNINLVSIFEWEDPNNPVNPANPSPRDVKELMYSGGEPYNCFSQNPCVIESNPSLICEAYYCCGMVSICEFIQFLFRKN
ncbi:MAG: hypothetical protein Hyperionvirus38_17 [Hyperionvirus sp.]|uniref:Uncharacterized protein n=1 Tax=Hyperionvirus sp. TaxID=2487770 RepID=A0A3G5AH99_9VIRU|nr:MAG: hypothetical protein Hyperionvirus38_17 [Hyperionvirus sp.]